jgi:hypothetical protein
MATSGKSASLATEQCMQSLFSLRFLTLTLSAPQGTDPKVRLKGTSDRVVFMDCSKNGDCVIMSVAELAHLLNFDMDRVVKQKYGYLLFDLGNNQIHGNIRQICQFSHRAMHAITVLAAVLNTNPIRPALYLPEGKTYRDL